MTNDGTVVHESRPMRPVPRMRVDRTSWLLKRALPVTVVALLVLTFLAIGLTYQASSRLLRESLDETSQASLRELVARIDSSFDIVDHLMVAMASDPDVRGYFSMNYPDLPSYLLEAKRVQHQLAVIRRTLPALRTILLTNFRHSEVMTHSITIPIAEYPDRSITSLVRRASIDGDIVGPRTTRFPDMMRTVEEEVLFQVRPYPLGVSGELATGGFIAVMQIRAMQQQVVRYATELGLSVNVYDSDSELVISNAGAAIHDAIAWESDPVVSRRTGLVFVARSATISSELRLRSFRTVVIVVALVGVLLACVFAFFLDRFLRRPWEDTVLAIAAEVEESTHPSEDAADRTAWSLPAIRRDVLDVIERARELEGRFEASRDAVLQQVLINHFVSPGTPNRDDTVLGQLGIEGPRYQTILLDLGRSSPTGPSALAGPLRYDLISLAERSFGASGVSRAVLLPDGVLGAVICPHDNTGIQRRARGLVIALRKQGYPNAAAAIGDIHSGAHAIHSSYVEATFALEFRVVRPETPVISYSDVSTHAAPLLPREVSEHLDRLRETMHRKSCTKLREWAESFLAAVETSCRVPVALKHALARFVSDAAEIATRLRIEIEAPMPDFHHSLWAGRNRTEVEDIFGRAVEWFCKAVERSAGTRHTERRGRELVRKVDDLLCDSSLSLTLLADSVGASNAHTSRLFRQTTGRTFQEYVAYSRAKEAERLLRESHDPVKEVARAVGYPEVHTLIRVFKRHYGVTPAEYRRGVRATVEQDPVVTGSGFGGAK